MSVFDEDLAAAADDLLSLAGNPVSYQRAAGGDPLEFDAYRTGELSSSTDTDGLVHINFDECDYTFAIASLAGHKPQAGDVITETINSVACRFEVLPITKRTCFAWNDPRHTQAIVHVKRIT